MNPVYTPSTGDLAAGSVTLSLHAAAQSPCDGDSTDSMVLTMVSGTTALAGEDATICEGMSYQLSGNALFFSIVIWTTSGDGSFSDPGILSPVYTPGINDVLNGGVTLTLKAIGSGEDSDYMYLEIGSRPTVELGPDRYIPHGIWIDLNSDVSGGTGDFTYFWEPSAMLVDPENPDPRTLNIYQNTTFTLYVTDKETGCDSELASIDVTIDGAPLGADPYSAPSVSCAGDNVQLFVNPLGGAGSYEDFVWIGTDGQVFTEENPVVEISQPTNFTIEFSDGYNSYSANLFVDLLPNPEVYIGGDIQIFCIYEHALLDAGNPGSEYVWSTGDTTQQVSLVTTGLAYDEQLVSVEVTNEYGCRNIASTTVIFDFDACVGIDEPGDQGRFIIYPNPSYGYFVIETIGMQGKTDVSFFNVNGLEVYHSSTELKESGSKIELNLGSLGHGIYFLQLLGDNYRKTTKIVIR